MLSQLLNEIALENALDTAGLAVRLDTSPAMVKAMLEHLERSGALEKIECCDGGCQACALASQCRTTESGNRLWRYEIPPKQP